jgi:hypothetical protein
MNEITLDQSDEERLTYEVSEGARGGGVGRESKHVYSVGLYFCVFLPWSLTAWRRQYPADASSRRLPLAVVRSQIGSTSAAHSAAAAFKHAG